MTKVVVRNGNVDGALRTFKQKNALTEKFIPVGHSHLIGRFTIQKIFFTFFSKVRNPVKEGCIADGRTGVLTF